MTLQENRERLMAHFSNGSSNDPKKWSALWDQGDFLPWDRGSPNPALVDLLADGKDLLENNFADDASGNRKSKKALVPGCGKGYDVLLLASFGYDTVGLEVSETAVKRCYEVMEVQGDEYPPRSKSGPGKAEFVIGDFFSDEWLAESHVVDRDGRFNLIYDYTFLCALPPSMRPQWALRMSQLLANDGSLICLEFPSSKDPRAGGPPFGLPAQVYTEHLSHPGKKLPYDDESGQIKEGISGPDSSERLKRVDRRKPNRTHPIGIGPDGKIMDWLSIWRH